MERSIGVAKNTFRCILGARQLYYKPEKATQIINACIALHNLRIKHKMQLDELEMHCNDQAQSSDIFETEDSTINTRDEIMNSIL